MNNTFQTYITEVKCGDSSQVHESNSKLTMCINKRLFTGHAIHTMDDGMRLFAQSEYSLTFYILRFHFICLVFHFLIVNVMSCC